MPARSQHVVAVNSGWLNCSTRTPCLSCLASMSMPAAAPLRHTQLPVGYNKQALARNSECHTPRTVTPAVLAAAGLHTAALLPGPLSYCRPPHTLSPSTVPRLPGEARVRAPHRSPRCRGQRAPRPRSRWGAILMRGTRQRSPVIQARCSPPTSLREPARASGPRPAPALCYVSKGKLKLLACSWVV